MPFDIPALNVIAVLYVFMLGACVGSFVNVLIYRIPRRLSFVRGTSFCPFCGNRVMPYDLIPLFSYMVLRGKCRRCGAGIPLSYPLVELASGAAAILSVLVCGFTLLALPFFLISAALLAVSVIDVRHRLIPNGLIYALAVLAAIYALLEGASGASLWSRAAGFFILSAPMLFITFLVPDAFGGGDIKLIAVGGFLLGARLILAAGFIALLLGGVWGVYVRYIKRDKKAGHIAFGQFICAGLFIALAWGGEIMRLYLSPAHTGF